MFDRTQIDPRVQKQLFRKIDSINRRELGGDSNSPFFVGNALDVSTKNPASEHLFRSCFAKVSVAVPNMKKDEKGKSTLVHQPISLSSYMNGQEEDEILGVKDNAKNTPLTFSQGVNEDEKNRFRGHSGITKISVSQQKYYTYKYTIDWNCPDPVYFEKVFEPNFLRLGSYMAIEFGWGIEDSEIKDVEPLTIEEMIRVLTPNEEQPEKGGGQALYERNLKNVELMIALHYLAGSKFKTPFWEYAEENAKKCLSNNVDKYFLEIYNLSKQYNSQNRTHMYKTHSHYEHGTWSLESYTMNLKQLNLYKKIDQILKESLTANYCVKCNGRLDQGSCPDC